MTNNKKKGFRFIVINGRFLEQKITGVQRFALEIVKTLDKIVPQTSNIILAVSSVADITLLGNLHNIRIEKIGKKHGILWEQTELALFIKKNHALGLYLCNAVPFIHPKGIVCIHDIAYKTHPEFAITPKNKLTKIWNVIQNNVGTKKSLAILTVSEYSKKEICETFMIPPEKITVVYNGWQHFSTTISENVTLTNFPFLKEGEFFFSMASLAKNKNFKWIIEVAKRNPNSTFVISGKNDLKKYGDTLSEGKGLSNIHYLGYVSDNEAKLLMKKCRAFIFPSIYEGFGIPPLEALAMGAKVICSNVTCLPEIFKDAVYYIDPYDYDVDIDVLLSEEVSPPSTVLDLYSWEKTTKKILDVVNKYFKVL